jgi:hypothetical protein
MKSKKNGAATSAAEIQGVTKLGLWLLVKGKEYFLGFKDYPWFRRASLADLFAVKLLHGHHLRWDKLDIDLELRSLDHPDRYPLRSKVI